MKISEEKFNYIYDTYLQELFNVAYGYTKNIDDSNDIVHNAFVKFLKCNSDFKTDNDIKFFLIRVVINESLDLLKSYYKRRVVKSDEFLLTIPDQNNDDSLGEIANTVSVLPEKYKTVIILHYYNLMKVKDIAITLKISETAVKKRLERARKLLKDIIERKLK